MIIFGIDIRIYFLLFMTYAILGWCMEVTCKLIQYKRFINRGFLIGPYCPIYGYGAILITFLLKKYTNDPVILFFMAIIICGTLEYLTSYFMEKIFKARWWDYSQKKFNINGRVCLENSIWFGLLGALLIYIVNPFLSSVIAMISDKVLIILGSVLLVIFITDLIISLNVTIRIKNTITKLVKKDSTEDFNHKIKEIINGKILNRRLFKAFPKIKINVKDKVIDFKNNIKEKIEKK